MVILKEQEFFRIPLSHKEKMEINEKYHLGINNVSWIGAEGLIRQALRFYEPNNPKGLLSIPVRDIDEYKPFINEKIYFI